MSGKRYRRGPDGELPRVRACGCIFYPGATLATHPCREAVGLEAAARLALAFVTAAPADPFFRRVAEVTRAAMLCHAGIAPAETPADPAPAGGAGWPALPAEGRYSAETVNA